MCVQNNIFDFVYIMALRDATMRKAYEGNTKHLFRKDEPKLLVEDYAKKVLAGVFINQKEADDSTYETIQNLASGFSEKEFTFGNAQKLLNMTMKYLYISAYGDTAKEQDYRDRFQFCHCPMDGSMIKTVYQNKEDNTIRDILSRGRKGRGLYSDTAWSKISADAKNSHNTLAAYEDFQMAIRSLAKRKKRIPLEIDYEFFLQ